MKPVGQSRDILTVRLRMGYVNVTIFSKSKYQMGEEKKINLASLSGMNKYTGICNTALWTVKSGKNKSLKYIDMFCKHFLKSNSYNTRFSGNRVQQGKNNQLGIKDNFINFRIKIWKSN